MTGEEPISNPLIAAWHEYMSIGDPAMLAAQLSHEPTFHSPIVHTPQRGTELVTAYLRAAFHVLGGEHFRYLRNFDCGHKAVLEFAAEIDGVSINGVDMIEWNDEGKIVDFKVMIRPLKAINIIHQSMGAMLAKQQS